VKKKGKPQPDPAPAAEPQAAEEEPVRIPVDGVLDLHTFQPREVKDAVIAYLEACREQNVLAVRIIHGKGSGSLQRTVHALLARTPYVVWFQNVGAEGGGWGATSVTLAPQGE
jgi:DNA-nicking Smr family endonuclease